MTISLRFPVDILLPNVMFIIFISRNIIQGFNATVVLHWHINGTLLLFLYRKEIFPDVKRGLKSNLVSRLEIPLCAFGVKPRVSSPWKACSVHMVGKPLVNFARKATCGGSEWLYLSVHNGVESHISMFV